eukprot:2371386-Rhodomonas_salina.2
MLSAMREETFHFLRKGSAPSRLAFRAKSHSCSWQGSGDSIAGLGSGFRVPIQGRGAGVLT